MRKYDLISALSAETSKEVARNEESWKKYLNTASRLYKYPFKDQILIYAQRPDATVLSVKLDAPAPCRLVASDLDFACRASADCLPQHLQVI